MVAQLGSYLRCCRCCCRIANSVQIIDGKYPSASNFNCIQQRRTVTFDSVYTSLLWMFSPTA